jgi:hypothetical protein
MSQT